MTCGESREKNVKREKWGYQSEYHRSVYESMYERDVTLTGW